MQEAPLSSAGRPNLLQRLDRAAAARQVVVDMSIELRTSARYSMTPAAVLGLMVDASS
jgi:hypothetical protein